MVNILNTDISERTTTEGYQAFVRSLRRHKGFGLLFVESTPVGGFDLIKKVSFDLQQKKINVLVLSKAINNLIKLIEVFPGQENLNILFIVGLEKSLVEYIRPGYGGKGYYYNLDTIPPILSHLNWQRENFRDRFRHLCFVFILPKYAIKYISLRAPDFFDWGSGKIQIATERDLVEQEVFRLAWLDSGFETYQNWTFQQRLERLAEIHTYLQENLDPNEKFDLYFEQALILSTNGDYEEAIASYDQALKFKPDYHEAWNNRGVALADLGRIEEAIASYDQALKFKPDYHEAWNNRGVALADLGRIEEAIASYNQALKFKPDYHEAWNNRGVALADLGRIEEAIASYNQALKFKPDFHEAWYGRGIALGKLGKMNEAIASYDKALKIKPDFHEIWFNRGIALGKLGKMKEAITSYEKALKIKPDDHEAWFNRGIALGNLGRLEEAIASYDKALKIKPDCHKAWNNRGSALDNLGRLEEAIAYYDNALKIKPDKPEVWNNLGIALRQLGRLEEAITSYDNALKIKSDLHEAWNNRGNALDDLGRYEEAITSYDQALKIKSNFHEVWNNRGNTLFNLGRLEEAITSYDQALKIKPDLAIGYFHKACAYALQENITFALNNLKQSINLNSKYLEMAKTDTDFDKIRNDFRFINLTEGFINLINFQKFNSRFY
jgi:tetratricopeptide (TPR) repeat protein